MAKTITWLNDDGKTCVISIADGSSSTTTLTPAAEPFTTSIQESDDIFTPIRSSNGYIRVVVDSVNDIADLVGSAPLSRAVTLTIGSTVRWIGFLACETFTQSWDRGPIEVELPVVSPLEVSKGVYPSSDLAKLGYINIAQFLWNMNHALGGGFSTSSAWSEFFFPVLSETPGTLRYQFDMKNYATATDKNSKHEMKSYYEILEDICKLFGWQAIEYEHDIVFLAADVKSIESGNTNAYRGYTQSRMLQIAQGTSSFVDDRPAFTAATPIIFGADHDMTWLAGRKSVEVVGQLNERDEVIWSLDVIGQCVYKGSDQYEIPASTSYHYYVKKYGCYAGGNVQPYNSVYSMASPDADGNNIKFVNFKNGNDIAYGGSIAYEKFYLSDDSNGHVVIGGSDSWVKRLVVRAVQGQSYVAHRIATNFQYSPSQNARTGFAPDAFMIKGSILYAASRQDFFENASGTHYTKVALKIEGTSTYYWSPANGWTTTYADFLIRSIDGEIKEYGYYHNGRTLFVPSIPAPTNIEGQVTMNILAAYSNDIETWPGTAYIAYENLEIQLVASENTRGVIKIEDREQREDENRTKIDLVNQYGEPNGFTEAWSQECGLTLAREAVPDSYGAVLDANRAQPSSLYGNAYPEDAMAERAKNYFGNARLRIRAIVESLNKMLSPMVTYTFTNGGQPYIVIEQQHNWRTNEVRASFYEPTYNAL